MTATIFLAATLEAAGLHDHLIAPPDSEGSISVRFGFRVEGETDAAARPRFEAFLTALKDAKFACLQMSAGQLAEDPDIQLTTAFSPPGTDVADLVDWIDARSHGRWNSSDTLGQDAELDPKQLDASRILDTTTTWVAPIPQNVGIVRLVSATTKLATLDLTDRIIVPLWTGHATPKTYSTVDGDVVIDYPAGPLAPVAIRTRGISIADKDDTSLVDDYTAFLKVTKEEPEVHATLKRIEERAATLLWTYPALATVDWRAAPADDAPPTTTKRLMWRGMNGLSSLLDPLFLSLTMAGTPGAEGPFISALAGEIVAKVPDAPVDRLVTLVRNKIGLLDVPANEHFQTAGKAGRAALAIRLRALFQLNLAAEVDSAVLPWLLFLYDEQGPTAVSDTALGAIAKATAIDLESSAPDALDRALDSELGDIAVALQTEDGMEAMLLRFLEVAGIDANALHVALGTGNLSDYEEALGAFRQFLADGFNGLDAVRQAQGLLFRRAFVAGADQLANTPPPPTKIRWTKDNLHDAISDADWFAARLGLSTGGTLAGVAGALKVYAQAALAPADQALAKGRLTDAYGDSSAVLSGTAGTVRFQPDHSPRTLPIQIGVDTDTTDEDDFADRFNGVAVLVRRAVKSGPPNRWAYANLAKVKVKRKGQPLPADELAGLTIQPLRPLAIDGQRNLFLEFSGVPLSATGLSEFTPDGEQAEPGQTPFYSVDSPTKDQLTAAGMERLPALRYGDEYEVAAHVVGNSGTLPTSVQLDATTPWVPTTAPDPSLLGPDFIQRYPYMRTTAVGRVVLTELPPPGERPRIGVGIEDVQPLQADYPRLGVSAPTGATGSLDLLRNSDGTGMFTLPVDGEAATIRLTDINCWATSGKLTLAIFRKADATAKDAGEVNITTNLVPVIGGAIEIDVEGDGQKWLITVSGSGGVPALTLDTDTLNAKSGEKEAIWIRLKIEGSAVSLADPAAALRTEHSASRPRPDSLLLVGRKDGDWLPEYGRSVRAEVVFPKVSYADFDRWTSNESLPGSVAPPAPGTSTPPATINDWNETRQRLFVAHIGRTADQRLAELIDALPDPAITRILVELTPLDRIAAPNNAKALKPATEVVLELAALNERPAPEADPKTILARLAALAKHHSAGVTISCEGTLLEVQKLPGTDDREHDLSIKVPPGVTARLTIRPLLAKKTDELGFGKASRMTELASEVRSVKGVDYLVLEGASLIIEGMQDQMADPGWATFVEPTVSVRTSGAYRSYDLVSGQNAGWQWRQVGTVDVHTQRWRHGGRPIYTWIDAKDGKPSTSAAVWLDHGIALSAPGDFGAFEREAFFDRSDADADIRTMRLNPQPTETVLQSFPWELPSATVFRHKFSLRSRYAGAMTPERAQATMCDGLGDRPWLRVAMLADLTRVQLTRPRLRALLPLTETPAENTATTPPIMALLDEPPVAQGGLADRIAAEIRTGFGFGFPQGENEVDMLDSRKEIGPDPRLTYAAMPADIASALSLRTEGPIGLTYESNTIRNPAFANSAFVLAPVALGADSKAADRLEEHFLSVQLRRYLDHRWLIDPDDAATPVPVDAASPWWFEFDGATTMRCEGQDILNVSLKGALWTATALKAAVNPGGPHETQTVDLSTIASLRPPGFGLLHLPLEPGRASLSIFARVPSADPEDGRSNLPLMLASFEWKVPTENSKLSFTGTVTPHRTSASPTTLMNWTRTGKNFGVLHAGAAVDGEPTPHHISDLVLREKSGSHEFVAQSSGATLGLEPSTGRYPNPVYAHRHLAVIQTRNTPGVGRPIEVFQAVHRLDGGKVAGLSSGDHARVLEFETPALPLAYGLPPAAPPTLSSAKFDLYSRFGAGLRDGTNLPLGYTINLRPLAGSVVHKTLTKLKLQIASHLLPGSTLPLVPPTSHELTFVPKNAPLLMVRLAIVNLDNTGKPTPTAQLAAKAVYGGGEVVDLGVDKLDTKLGSFAEVGALELTIKGVTAGTPVNEFWADASILAWPRDRGDVPQTFSFDWFFTGTDKAPGLALTPTELRQMVETQARIISISPAIPVT